MPATGTDVLEVRSPFDGSLAGRTTNATAQDVETAVAAAAAARGVCSSTPAHVRAAALDHVSRRLAERSEEIAALITAESGKPLKWSRLEVTRAVSTFRWGAEEARRWSGTLQRLDTDPAAGGRMALVRRAPRGPVLGIAPFNFPLNLVAHKVAPAIAVGAPIVLKPAPATPLTALLLGELLAESDLPAGSWSVLPVPDEVAAELVRDPRLPVVSFTGSVPVGWSIRESAPHKHVTLELGGNAAAVVAPDQDEAALDWVAARIATFAMYQAGQSCISVQREAFTRVNDSRFGLQAGIFTRDLQLAFRAAQVLEVGGVVVGDVPSVRADQMPYGRVKDSGTGREGVHAAMEDLTEERVLVLTGIDV